MADMEVNMVADMELAIIVVDMEVDMLANQVEDMVADISSLLSSFVFDI